MRHSFRDVLVTELRLRQEAQEGIDALFDKKLKLECVELTVVVYSRSRFDQLPESVNSNELLFDEDRAKIVEIACAPFLLEDDRLI